MCFLVERTTTECNDPPAKIADREHHPVAKTIVGYRDIIGRHQKAGLDHVLDRHAEAAEVLLKSETLGRSVTDAESELGDRIKAAVGQIAARPSAGPTGQRRLKKFSSKRNHFVESAATPLLGLGLTGHFRHRQTGKRGQSLHRLRESDPLRFHRESEDVAMLSGREIVIEPLLIIDEK